MPGTKGTKRLTEKEFKNIKLLQQAGLNASQAADVTKRSSGLTSMVYRCDTLKDYKQYRQKLTHKSKAEAVAPAPSVVGEDAHLILDRLKTIEDCLNQLLHIIEDKEAKANASFWRR